MKIKVKDILPNPYRNIEHYPFDAAKIENLKRSIQEKTFWDNILIRQKDGKFELVYGHHRLEALKQLKIKEIDVPVRTNKEISDALMVQIMAEENHEWSQTPAMMNQTVDAVKKFLDTELAKYKTVKQLLTANKSISGLFSKDPNRYGQQRKEGVGQTTILKFLGGNWKQWQIQEALDNLGYSKTAKEKGTIDLEAVGTIPSLSQAKVFKKVVREHKLGSHKQRQLAKKIAKEDIGLRTIEQAVNEFLPPKLKKKQQSKPKPLPMLDDFASKTSKKVSQIYTELVQIEKAFENIQDESVQADLYLSLKDLQTILTKILKKWGQNEKKRNQIV